MNTNLNNQTKKEPRLKWMGLTCFVLGLFIFGLNLSGYSADKSVHYIQIHGEISPGMASYLGRSLEAVTAETSAGVVLGINTFGGRVDAALKMVEHIEAVKGIPVYAYVEDSAWSAGALISLACEKILMQEGSTIGSAAPVTMAGTKGTTEALGEKHVSAIRAKFEALAERNGYSSDLAAAMVDQAIEVVEVDDEGVKKIMTRTEYEDIKAQHADKVMSIVSTISKADKLVNLTAQKAKEIGLATEVFKSRAELDQYASEQLGVSLSAIEEIVPGPLEKFVSVVTSMAVASVLMSLGLMLIYVEFQAPGIGWAGITGLFCLGLVFGGQYLIDYAEYTEILLFAIGIVLVCLELFVIPGFGVPGILGILCLGLSLYLVFVPFGFPKEPWEYMQMKRSISTLLLGLFGSFAGIFFLLSNLHRIPILNRLVLNTTLKQTPIEKRSKLIRSNIEVGTEGTAVSNLRPVGKARFGMGLVDVVSETGIIEPGSKIKVVGKKEYEYIVTKINSKKKQGGK